MAFLVEINGHGNICNKLGVVGKGLLIKLLEYNHVGFQELLEILDSLCLVHVLIKEEVYRFGNSQLIIAESNLSR